MFPFPIFHSLKFYLTNKAQLNNPSLIPLNPNQYQFALCFLRFPTIQLSILTRAQ